MVSKEHTAHLNTCTTERAQKEQFKDTVLHAACVQNTNIKVQQIQKEHFKVPPQSMEFIAMDLIGEFHPIPPAKKTGMHSLHYAC